MIDTNELRDVKKEKKKKEEQWAGSLGFGDVVFDKQLTKIESIGGVPFETWKVKMLISFCRGNNIKIVNGKQKKDDLVNTIINHKKHGPIRTK